MFEKALVQFHRAHRARPAAIFAEWITRCEETIKGFLKSSKVDSNIVEQLLEDEEHKNWSGCFAEKERSTKQNESTKHSSDVDEDKTIEMNQAALKDTDNEKKTGRIMGKIHQDMVFLDKIAKHPALQKNLLLEGENRKSRKDIENVLQEIRGAAEDGLSFLQVRKTFWETSEPQVTKERKKKSLRRSRSDSVRLQTEGLIV